ncbi:type IV secretion system DNA-binding domain-containing protein [Devosia sp. A369]
MTALIDRVTELRTGYINDRIWPSVWMGLGIGALAATRTGYQHWRDTPRTEPFISEDPSDPQIFYDEAAEATLKHRLSAKAGADERNGISIAPHIALSQRLERKNILIVGAPGSGKSNLVRPIAQQAIARGDLVVLHCTKGDVARAFRQQDIVLLSPAHRDGWAWDIGADISGPAAAAEFAITVIPESKEAFFSTTARLVLTDIIVALGAERGAHWGPRELLQHVLSQPGELAAMIGNLDLSASPLLGYGNPDEVSRTVESVLATLVSGAMTTLRPMALAWTDLPATRRFSIKAMLSRKWRGPKVLIVQTHPGYPALSESICGGVLRRICQAIAAPRSATTYMPAVTMVLDEFSTLGRVEGLEGSLAVAREQGLAMAIALQDISQLKIYGDAATALESFFQFKIFGMQQTGEATNALAEMLGKRKIAVTLQNRLPKADDKRRWVSERENYPLFSPTQFARDLGNFDPATPDEVIKTLLLFEGDAYRLDWPPTKWGTQGLGFVAAAWTKGHPPQAPEQAEPQR